MFPNEDAVQGVLQWEEPTLVVDGRTVGVVTGTTTSVAFVNGAKGPPILDCFEGTIADPCACVLCCVILCSCLYEKGEENGRDTNK